jgi:colicin import membrane protein
MATRVLNQRLEFLPRSDFVASLILHSSIILFFIISKILDHYGFHLFGARKSKMDLYQTFIQVDVVALPDQMINEKIDVNQPVVDMPRKEANPDKALNKDDTLEDKLKAEEAMAEKTRKEKEDKAAKAKALKELKEQASREKALKALQSKAGKTGRGKVAGNILSKGTAMTGNIGNAKDRYTALVTQAIKEHFKIYPWQRKKNLNTVVYITIFPTGRVREKRLMRRSADSTFDSAVLQAIDEAQPLPVPEDPAIIGEGITIEFRPEG